MALGKGNTGTRIAVYPAKLTSIFVHLGLTTVAFTWILLSGLYSQIPGYLELPSKSGRQLLSGLTRLNPRWNRPSFAWNPSESSAFRPRVPLGRGAGLPGRVIALQAGCFSYWSRTLTDPVPDYLCSLQPTSPGISCDINIQTAHLEK